MTFPLVVDQVTGFQRSIHLRGRAIPYRGPGWGGELNVQVNFFPGNPNATAQVIGPTELPTEFRGMWKDRFLFPDPLAPDNTSLLLNFPRLTEAAIARPVDLGAAFFVGGPTFEGGTVLNQKATTARALRDAFRLLRREGQLLRVEWGSIARFGFLKRDWMPHEREEDINWELVFDWIGDSDTTPELVIPVFDALGLLKRILAALAAVVNLLRGLLLRARLFLLRITQPINAIGTFVREMAGFLEGLATFALLPGDILAQINANLIGIILATRDAFRAIDESSAALEASFTGNPVDIALASLIQKDIRRRLQELGARAAEQQRLIAEFDAPQILGVIAIQGGVTLRDISRDFFNGDPDNWQAIADFNGFDTAIVPAGTIVRIPSL